MIAMIDYYGIQNIVIFLRLLCLTHKILSGCSFSDEKVAILSPDKGEIYSSFGSLKLSSRILKVIYYSYNTPNPKASYHIDSA